MQRTGQLSDVQIMFAALRQVITHPVASASNARIPAWTPKPKYIRQGFSSYLRLGTAIVFLIIILNVFL
jgi:hypothetical protein